MTEMEETLTGFKCFCKINVSFPRANGEFNEVKFCLIKKMIASAFGASIVGGMTQQLRHQRRRRRCHHFGRLGWTPVAAGWTLVVLDTTLARFGLKSVAIGLTLVVSGAVGSILAVFDWTLAALGTKLAQFGLKLEAFDSTLVAADPIAGAVGSTVAVLDWKPVAPGTKLVLLAATLAVSGLKLVVSGSKPAAAVHPVVPGYPGRYCLEPWWFLLQRTAP